VLEIAGVGPGVPQLVTFARMQAGMSSLVGCFEVDGQPYVLKMLKTEEVRRWAFGEQSLREPRSVRLLRRASARWDSLAPRSSLWRTLERFNANCQEWLQAVARDTAEEALLSTEGARPATVAALIEQLFENRESLCFSPMLSQRVWVSCGNGGPQNVFAVTQDAIGSPGALAAPFSMRFRLRPRQFRRLEQLRRLEFLALLAYANLLAGKHGLGLDLAPRFRSGEIFVPNALVRADCVRLAYTDYFGLAQRDGNAVEAAAFRALYGRWGLIPQLSSWTLRSLARRNRAWSP
jgi:hypothetical protein